MSADEPKKRDQSAARAGAQGLYVYAIGERVALVKVFKDALPSAIETEAGLELIGQSELAAVTSLVPLEDYGDDALQTQLTDATWTAIRAMRHEKVVEHFARRVSVVPLRFGTIYLEREGVEAMLSERSAELRTIIERLGGREEWGLNIYYDRLRLKESITSLSPRLREMVTQAEAASPGQSYLMRKKIEALRESEGRVELKRMAGEIEKRLSIRSEAAARLRVLKDEAAEHGELAARFAFLVERDNFAAFRAEAEKLAEEYVDAGFQLELTGPWPAYNFAANS